MQVAMWQTFTHCVCVCVCVCVHIYMYMKRFRVSVFIATYATSKTVTLISTSSKHIKGSKERCLLGQNSTCKLSGVIPFMKLQNDTKATVKQWKTMKNDMES